MSQPWTEVSFVKPQTAQPASTSPKVRRQHQSPSLLRALGTASLARAARRIVGNVSTVEQPDQEPHLHLFAADDPRLWEFRSRLTPEEFTIPGLRDDEWDAFHTIIADA